VVIREDRGTGGGTPLLAGPPRRAFPSHIKGEVLSFFQKAILIAGKCLKERHHHLAMSHPLGRFDDLMVMLKMNAGIPGPGISVPFRPAN
jgi:hypothetical protein